MLQYGRFIIINLNATCLITRFIKECTLDLNLVGSINGRALTELT